MLALLLAHENWPFALALALVVALGFFEILAVVLGLSLLNTIDDILPTGFDHDDLTHKSTLNLLLDWLCLGRLPLLIWLLLTFTAFSLFGFIGNYLSLSYVNHYQSAHVMASTSIVLTIITVHLVGRSLANIIPKNKYKTAHRDDLAGSVGKVTLGIASYDSPAEATIKDAFLQKHYVQIIPDSPRETFQQGTSIIILRRQDKIWLAARYQK